MLSARFPRHGWLFMTAAWMAASLPAFPHGVDTYNLMSKLFVEEYHARYARTAPPPDEAWAAYPVEARYATFEDVFYLYLLSQVDPDAAQFPPARPVPEESLLGFIVLRTVKPGEPGVLARLDARAFALQLDSQPRVDAEKAEDDPLHRFTALADTRPDSRLVWFPRPRWDPAAPPLPHELRLVIRRPAPAAPVILTWKIPDRFPVGNARYESDIWTVVRERYAVMPMPPHAAGTAPGAAGPRAP